MISSCEQKQALSAVYNPLGDAGILQHVFTFLPGDWLCLGAVCSEWRQCYTGIGGQQVCSLSAYSNKTLVDCGFKTTLYSAAVASPATARLASTCGLQIGTKDNYKLQWIAGLHADVDTLTALSELGMPLSETVVNAVAVSGRLNILQHLLLDQQCPIPLGLSHYAARSGSISMLQWLKAEDLCEFDDFTCEGAANAGQLAALQHLRSEGCEWHESHLTSCAASGGSIAVVDWLRQQQGIVLDAEVMSSAVSTGQLAMCKYLHAAGCAWDASACTYAAIYGAIEVLQWLRENGCPWDSSAVCKLAAYYGFPAILDCVIEQGEVLDAELLTEALNGAGAYGKLQAAQWLKEHGAEWPVVLKHSDGRQWSGESLAWARAEGCTSPVTL
jgi:uncharacterized metal-binding protein